MKTTKKNIKVKKGKGDISITIENNLNANNKQINHQPIKRRRRRKKVEDNEEINKETLQQSPQELPQELPSYIKPGPVGAFKIWQNTMDSYNTTVPMNQAQQLGVVPPQLPAPSTQLSLPAPPTPLALPAPPTQLALPAPEQPLTLENFKQVLSMMANNQRNIRAPPEWGRNLIDQPRNDDSDDSDDDKVGAVLRSVPLSPVTSFSRRSLPPPPVRQEQDDNLNQSIASVYGVTSDDPEMPAVNEEVKKILTLTAARSQGTKHGKRNIPPQGNYKDMPEYQENYNKAKQSLLPTPIIPGAGKTRGQKKLSIAEKLAAGREFRESLETANANRIFSGQTQTISTSPEVRKFETNNPIYSDAAKLLFSKKELDEINEQAKQLNEQLAPFANWNEEQELSRAGLGRIIMTNEDAEDAETETNRLLFGT
jgi:hypothetical protein